MPRKPKYHDGQVKKFVSLSFTAPTQLEEPMSKAAAARGMNRSQYICWLVQQDIYFSQRSPAPTGNNYLPAVPPRIRRKQKEKNI